MTTPVVMARDEDVTLYRDSRGALSTRERGAMGERNKVVALGIVFEPCCACCDRPLDYEERRDAPQMYTDGLCKTCLQWVGRVLVAWLGEDKDVAPDPFWIDTNEWGS